MEKFINVSKILSNDIRLRRNADVIRAEAENAECTIVNIDLDGVVFVSRSFADELINIVEQTKGKNVNIINAEGVVKNMLSVVERSRKRERVHVETGGDVVRLQDMGALQSFLATM